MIFEDEDEFRENGTSKYITCTYYPVINSIRNIKSSDQHSKIIFVEE